jgi:hypothetical protein
MTRWSQGLIERNFYVGFALENLESPEISVLHLTIVFGPVACQDWNTETPGTERRTPGAKRSGDGPNVAIDRISMLMTSSSAPSRSVWKNLQHWWTAREEVRRTSLRNSILL